MRNLRLASLITLSVLALACAEPEAPAVPSWDVDVYPILRGSCSHCHGVTVAPGATPVSRLDVCDSAAFGGINPPLGAKLSASAIVAYIKPAKPGARPQMPPPPGGTLSDYDVEVLEKWAARGADCTKQVQNRPPVLRIVKPAARDASNRVLVTIEVVDPDGDQVLGKVKLGAADEQVMPGAGRREFQFTGVQPTDRLSVTLYDGYSTATY